MASIQRSLLIEAPISLSYAFWCDFERYPSFMEEVASVAVDGRRMTWQHHPGRTPERREIDIVEVVDQRRIEWRQDGSEERGVVITFAPLEGDATWFTFTLDYAAADGDPGVADRLTAVSRRLDRELRQARELIEQAYISSSARFGEAKSKC